MKIRIEPSYDVYNEKEELIIENIETSDDRDVELSDLIEKTITHIEESDIVPGALILTLE